MSWLSEDVVSRMMGKQLIVGIVGALRATALVFTPTVGNLWSLATERGFIIPEESSVFTFRATRMNTGSGEWWLYGEDGRYYYVQGEQSGPLYVAFPKSEVSRCPSFRPHDRTAWCAALERSHESP